MFVAHLGVFTEALYVASPALRRWAWRKYVCELDPMRLARLAPPQPSIAEFLTGAKGLRDRRRTLQRGRVEMTEWRLPAMTTVRLIVDQAQPNFVECCFAYAANTARNHARALAHAQADTLGNAEYFSWYYRHVFRSQALLELMALKARCRDTGFDVPVETARELALSYLTDLENDLRRS